ncbi:EutN/CcmL family microcompartment protein [Vallitalea okinawensis]|uniref:EutN/CcmL family microcompartment protein n=1 Tax=Vallitalea okinawensis TaxID=2078660 RepID=UPI000CFB2CB5|nr:EutN/CcmL family microcompartment protein [Vallitalea okinawensis]
MILGRVIGTVVSTRKHDTLTGCKFLIVETIEEMGQQRMVAVDTVGAGISDLVMVAQGSSARIAHYKEHAPIDAAIIGIIDNENEIVIK